MGASVRIPVAVFTVLALAISAAAVVVDDSRSVASATVMDPSFVDGLIAASSDRSDSDSDGLPDVVEQALGLDDTTADSDGDSLSDEYEIQQWLDPLDGDTNNDGLGDEFELKAPPDFDGDGQENVRDIDDDGDGVWDREDLSPYGYSGTASSLDVDVTTDGEPAFVDFAVRPADASQFAYAGAQYDWPIDREGQMQDRDNSEEDVTITPTLEITAPSGPTQDDLGPYGVTVLEPNELAGEAKGSFKAQVSLVPVEVDGEPQAFYGRMYFPAGTSPGSLKVEFAWRVNGMTDQTSRTVALADLDFRSFPENTVITNTTHVGSCRLGKGEMGRVTCAQPLTGGAAFDQNDLFNGYVPAVPTNAGTIDEWAADDPAMDDPGSRILIDNDKDLSSVPVGTVVENTSQGGARCYVGQAEKHRLICSAPGLPSGYSFVTGNNYLLYEPGDRNPIRFGEIVTFGLTDTEQVTLARYHEDFRLTGMDVTVNKGVDVAALATDDPKALFPTAVALDVAFGQTQATVGEALQSLTDTYHPPGLRTATSTYTQTDTALAESATDLVPQVLAGLGDEDTLAVPALVALEERSASAAPAQWDSSQFGTTSLQVDLRDAPEVVSKTMKLTWYRPPQGDGDTKYHVTDANQAIAEMDRWGMEKEAFAKGAAMALDWMAGIAQIVKVKATAIVNGYIYPKTVEDAVRNAYGAVDKLNTFIGFGADIYLGIQFKNAAETAKVLDAVKSVTYKKLFWNSKAMNSLTDVIGNTKSAIAVRNLLARAQNVPGLAKVAVKALKWGKLLKTVGKGLAVVGILIDAAFAVAAFVGYIQKLGFTFEGVLRGTLAALPSLIGIAFGMIALLATNPGTILVAAVAAIVLAVLTWIFGKKINEALQSIGDFFSGKDADFPITNVSFVTNGVRAPDFDTWDRDDNGLTAGDDLSVWVQMQTKAYGDPDPAAQDPTRAKLNETVITPVVQGCNELDGDTCVGNVVDGAVPEAVNMPGYWPRWSPRSFEGAVGSRTCGAEIAALEAQGQVVDPRECSKTNLWFAWAKVPLQTSGRNMVIGTRIHYTGLVWSHHCDWWAFGECHPLGSPLWNDKTLPVDQKTGWQTATFDVLPPSIDYFPDWAANQGLIDLDPDHDGLINRDEDTAGTDPAKYDTDRDGLKDAFEVNYGGVDGALNPRMKDSDSDGRLDHTEVRYGTDPRVADTDKDGLSDLDEVNGWTARFFHGGQQFEVHVSSDPLVDDADGDGLGDLAERAAATNPRVAEPDGDSACDRIQPTGTTSTSGDDLVLGSPGDDTFTLAAPVGHDVVCGFGGNDTVRIAGTAAAETVTIDPGGVTRGAARVRLDRVEALAGTGEGGNDRFTVTPSPTMLVDVDGGSGDDEVTFLQEGRRRVVDWGAAFTVPNRQPVRYRSMAWRVQQTEDAAVRYDDKVTRLNDLYRSAARAVGGDYRPVVGDFDGSGTDDVLWYAPGSTADSVWWNVHLVGDAVVYDRRTSASVSGTFTPVVEDYDGDGRDDVFWFAPGSAADAVWYGGPTGFTSRSASVNGTYLPVPTRVGSHGAIFWYGKGSARESMWIGRDDRTFAGVAAPQVNGTTYRPVAMADRNGDPGILWYAPGAAVDTLWGGLSASGGPPATTQRVTVNGTYQPVGQYPAVLFYGSGTAGDGSAGVDLFGTGYRTLPASIGGTYRVAAGPNAGLVVWYGPGSAGDTFWFVDR